MEESRETYVKNFVLENHNKFCKERGYDTVKIEDIEIIDKDLNQEFVNKTSHIQNGVYAVNSGYEDIYKIEVEDITYIVIDLYIYHAKSKDIVYNKLEINVL